MKHNHLAVVVAVVASQALGFLWYGVLFLDVWARGFGLDPAAVDQANPAPFAIGIASNFLGAYGLSWLIQKTGGRGAAGGAALGFMVWLFFVGGTVATHHAFGQVGPGATLVDVSNVLVSLMLVGAIVGARLPERPVIPAVP